MEYKIAIPSYKRHTTLKKKTMQVLAHYKVPAKIIHIFVANQEEAALYRNTLDKGTYGKIVVGKPGIREIRNFMANYFAEGEKIVYLDDDISKIWQCFSKGDPKSKKDNKLWLMEINPRLGGGVIASIEAGCDIPKMLISDILDYDVKRSISNTKLIMKRYFDEIFYEDNS